jgi:hypothetical protein
MGIPRFFKLPQHKKFNYQPLYYDPEKEARIARENRIAKDMGISDGEEFRSRITKGSMREYFKRDKRVRKQSNVRLIIIAAVLFLIAYLLLFR